MSGRHLSEPDGTDDGTVGSLDPVGTLGSVERVDEDWRISFVRDYGHPVDAVWSMLTDPALTRLWWADARIEPGVGGRFDLRWLNSPEAGAWWPGAVTVWQPPHVLEFTNSEHGLLRWELRATDAGTRLRFIDLIRPAEERFVAMSLAGWHLHLDHLAEALDGTGQDWDAWLERWLPTWQERHAEYAARVVR
ncbi:MAG: SRPBCC family protein [Leifsonia flava]